jgi:hypothetical protein
MMNRRQQAQMHRLEIGPIQEAKAVYADALATYRATQGRITETAQQLRQAAEVLDSAPLRVSPLDPRAADAGVPLHVTTGPFRSELAMSDWPDVERIMQALGELHRAHTRVQALYAWLLPSDRAAVEAP